LAAMLAKGHASIYTAELAPNANPTMLGFCL